MRPLIGLACLASLFFSTKAIGAESADTKAMQGNWQVVKYVGVEAEEDAAGARMIVTGDKLTMKFKDGEKTSTFSLDSTKNPKQIDLIDQKDRKARKTLAIYELNGDDLRICVAAGDAAPRPKSFTLPKNAFVMIIVLKREKA